MGRKRLFVHFRLPPYATPRSAWRRLIHAAAEVAFAKAGVTIKRSDDLAIAVRLYLSPGALRFHDVDNRLKDILDALQGHV